MGYQILPDFSEAVEFTNLPAGTYKVRVTEAKVKTSQKGTPLVDWTLTTFGSETPSHNGRNIWHTTPTVGKGAGILKQFLRALTGEEPLQKPFDTDDYMGRECRVSVIEGLKEDGTPTGYLKVKTVESIR